MPVFLGVDGGATKTLAVVGDHTGHVLGTGLSGPTNYQITGIELAMKNLGSAVSTACSRADVDPRQISYGVFGLAGADYPIDFETLENAITVAYPGIAFEVINDAWVGFRSGTENSYGGVVISGTGANFAAATPEGKRVTGRGMGYEWGGEGGAGSLIKAALHFGFRSNDGTGPKTALEQTILSTLGFASYDDLSLHMYRSSGKMSTFYGLSAELVPAVFELANEGDTVCADILMNLGNNLGEIMGRMIKSLGFGQVPHDVVTVGSLFTKGVSPLLRDSFALSCHRFAPFARFRLPQIEPGGGAYLEALGKAGIDMKHEVRQKAIDTFAALSVL